MNHEALRGQPFYGQASISINHAYVLVWVHFMVDSSVSCSFVMYWCWACDRYTRTNSLLLHLVDLVTSVLTNVFTFFDFPLRKEFWNSFLWPEIRECSLATLSSHPLMIHGLSAKARSASSRGYPFVAHFIVSVARMQVLSIPTHEFEPLESLKHPKNAKHEAEEGLEAAMLSGCNSRLLSKLFRDILHFAGYALCNHSGLLES